MIMGGIMQEESNALDVFSRLFNGAQKECFRLQLLGTYLVDDEKEAFGKFLREGKISTVLYPDFLNMIKKKNLQGVRYATLNVVDMPLTPYMRFLIDFYKQTQERGHEVYMLERGKAKVPLGTTDFWMFDEKTALPVRYDNDGNWLGFGAQITNSEKIRGFVDVKRNLLRKAAPLSEFMKDINAGSNAHARHEKGSGKRLVKSH